jgi:hypothetical protein
VDAYGNHAIPGESFKFGMGLSKEKEKLASAKEYPFEGRWDHADGDIFEIIFTATVSGTCEMHVWADPLGKGDRQACPGSPFSVHVQAGPASSTASHVDGWAKESRGLDMHGKAIQVDTTQIIAGDTIFFRPQVLDANGNMAVLPEGKLLITMCTSDGMSNPLSYTPASRGGVTTYDARFECIVRGQHEAHITLFGEHIKGSPVDFEVLAARAEPGNCKLVMPKEPILFCNIPAVVTLQTYDKYGNPGHKGGLSTAARLQLVKQSLHDPTQLMPNNHTLETIDNGDGTYAVFVTVFKIAATLKLIVNMDKNLPAAGGELPAVTLNFVKDEETERQEREQKAAASPVSPDGDQSGPSPTRRRGSVSLMKKSILTVMEGMGKSDERRKKDPLVVAVEAFGEGAAKRNHAAGNVVAMP